MANPYINLYMNNPTSSFTNGTIISTDGTYTSPLSITLDASISETKIVTLGIRTESGYETYGGTTIATSGDTGDHWKLKLENAAEGWTEGWADSITFTDTITTTNTLFYAKVSSETSEQPQNDRSVSLQVTATIVATAT